MRRLLAPDPLHRRLQRLRRRRHRDRSRRPPPPARPPRPRAPTRRRPARPPPPRAPTTSSRPTRRPATTRPAPAPTCPAAPAARSCLSRDTSLPGPWPVGARTVTIGGLTVEVWYPAELGSEAEQEKIRYDIRTGLPDAEQGKVPDADNPWQDCECWQDLPLDADHGPYPAVIFVARHRRVPLAVARAHGPLGQPRLRRPRRRPPGPVAQGPARLAVRGADGAAEPRRRPRPARRGAGRPGRRPGVRGRSRRRRAASPWPATAPAAARSRTRAARRAC